MITNNATELSNLIINKNNYVTNKMLKTIHKMFGVFREIAICVVGYFGGTHYRLHGSKSMVCVVAVRQTTP